MNNERVRARDHLLDPWCDFRLRGFREVRTAQGVAWSATVTHDGEITTRSQGAIIVKERVQL